MFRKQPSDLFLSNDNDNSSLTISNLLLLLTATAMVIYLIERCGKSLEAYNRLDYDRRAARIISGLFRFIVNSLHTKNNDIRLPDGEGKIFVVGPHRTGFVDAAVFASKMQGTPPTFLATDFFNRIPGVSTLLRLTKTIEVPTNTAGLSPGKKNVVQLACEVLDSNGCIVLFPQGSFSRPGQEPPIVRRGAAEIALKSKKPIYIYRLDGFPSIENASLPLFITNNSLYRAFFTAFFPNNVTVRDCGVIDEHLKPENADLTEDQKLKLLDKLCADMFGHFFVTKSLTRQQNDLLDTTIADKRHLTIWNNRMKQLSLEKDLKIIKQTASEQVDEVLTEMKLEGQALKRSR